LLGHFVTLFQAKSSRKSVLISGHALGLIQSHSVGCLFWRPRADRFHVCDDALWQLGPLIQETELTQLVVLFEAEAVKSGLLEGAHLMPSFLN
jgi:hypothetical protein